MQTKRQIKSLFICLNLIFVSFCWIHNTSFAASLSSTKTKTLPKGIMTLDSRQAPPLILKNMDEDTVDLMSSRGKWAFVHFWATWCGPCRREMPTIQKMSEKIDGNKIDIILVNTAESEDTIFEFLGIVAPDINSLIDANGAITEQWQPRGLPATFFVSPDGQLKYLALGGRDWSDAIYLNFIQELK